MHNFQRVFRSLIISLLFAAFIAIPALTGKAQVVTESAADSGFFVENVGQFSGEGVFLLHGNQGYTWAAPDGIWVTRLQSTFEEATRGESQGHWKVTGGVNLRLSFKGANPTPELKPYGRLETHVSYLKGRDPADWHVNVPIWSGVRYVDLYPGIDLILDIDAAGKMYWQLEAESGAQTSQVKLEVQGADNVQVNGNSLRVTTGIGEYLLPLPELKLDTFLNAKETRSITTVTRTESDRFVVNVPFVDDETSRPAEISLQGAEELLFSTFLGGSGVETVNGVAVNDAQEVFATGETLSQDFPVSVGGFDVGLDNTDAFVVRMNKDGDGIFYATYLGGSSFDTANGIAVNGNIAYIVGSTFSDDFPQVGLKNGEQDAFVAAINESGTDLIYAKLHGGEDDDYGYGIDVESGFAYITGTTWSKYIPGASPPAKMRGYAAKFDASGNRLYGIVFGGRNLDAAYAIKVSGGSAYITGESDSFDLGPGGTYIPGVDDTYVIKLGASGEKIYARMLGGSQFERGNAITVDSSGRAVIVGSSNSSDILVTEGSYAGNTDAFIAVLNAAGTSWDYVAYLGGTGADSAASVSVDISNGLQVFGESTSGNFPVTPDAFQSAIAGSQDLFLVRYDLAGTDSGHLDYATYLGGTGSDQAQSLANDLWGYTYLGGSTNSPDFPLNFGAFDTSLGGSQDGFIAKLGIGPIPEVVLKKYTNGADADAPPGPHLQVGSQVNWSYWVANTGPLTLSNVTVTDNMGVTITCPKTTLGSTESMTCTATGIAVLGQYSNIGSVTANPLVGLPQVSASDPSHYFGVSPGVALDFRINDLPANEPPGPSIPINSTIDLTYIVTNTGNYLLDNITVSDNANNTISCPMTSLAKSASMTCTTQDISQEGVHTLTATVNGSVNGWGVMDTDEIYYTGIPNNFYVFLPFIRR